MRTPSSSSAVEHVENEVHKTRRRGRTETHQTKKTRQDKSQEKHNTAQHNTQHKQKTTYVPRRYDFIPFSRHIWDTKDGLSDSECQVSTFRSNRISKPSCFVERLSERQTKTKRKTRQDKTRQDKTRQDRADQSHMHLNRAPGP
jgi:hypothetical protein